MRDDQFASPRSAGVPADGPRLHRGVNDVARQPRALETVPSRLPGFDLNLLGVIAAVLETGSVSKAASQLGISQPTASGALAKLRDHFKDPLFVRLSKGMTPTPRGAELASTARDILRQLGERLGPGDHFVPKEAQKPYVFALSDVGEIVFLPRLLSACRRASPGTSVRSVSLRPTDLAAALEAGEVDLAVGYFPDLQRANFLQQRLITHHFVCLLRADHPIQGTRLTMGEFLSLDHAVVLSEGRSQEIFEATLQARGLARRIALYTPHFLSIPELIAQSDMVVTVPHALGMVYGKASRGLRVIQPPFPSPAIELRQHWHSRFHRDARNVWLRGLVSELFNESTDEWVESLPPADASAPALALTGPEPPVLAGQRKRAR